MKTLYIHRHAKSSWNEAGVADHDRPLNKRGHKNAEFMAKRFAKEKKLDLILSSTANRALSTAAYYKDALQLSSKQILTDKAIYFAAYEDMLGLINRLPEEADRVMLFGHNPTFTDLAHYLDHSFNGYLVTCASVEITFDLPTWDMISRDTGEVRLHLYPKLFPEMRD